LGVVARPNFPEHDRVLGIDPGTAVTGFGVILRTGMDDVRLVECGAIRTSINRGLPQRIREIFEAVGELVDRHRPVTVAVERVFQGKNARSALTLGHSRGAAILAVALRDIEIAEYAPRQIKKAVTGVGNATKEQVGFMVMRHLRLGEPPSPADAADGVAVALCHSMIGGPSPRILRSSPMEVRP